jgi:hypothetical protein
MNRRCAVAAAACLGLLLVAPWAFAGTILAPTDDGYSANDPNRGPGVGGDRTDFFEVRHNTTAPRKRIGYLKYDISGIEPRFYWSAKLSGVFQSSSHDNAGVWNVYGLNDGVTNTDDIADGSFGEANWIENNLTYSKGLGVDPSATTADSSLGLDLSEITLLGTITIPGNAPFVSNPTGLPLGAFLGADTNGLVTFLLTDANAAGTEWRVGVRENANAPGVQLSFVPEPTAVLLSIVSFMGTTLFVRRRS